VFIHNVDSSSEDEPLRIARLGQGFKLTPMTLRLKSQSLTDA